MMEERASDDFSMEMAVDPDSFIDGFSKVEILEKEKTEMESLDLKEMDSPDILETEKTEMESPDLDETDDEEEEMRWNALRDKEEEMWNALRELDSDQEEDEVKDDDNTSCYNRIVFNFSEEVSEEYLESVWKSKVESLFKSHSLSCELNWPERKMIVATKTPFVRSEYLNKGACALALLSYPGLPSEWLDQIFSDKVHCEYIRLTLPDDLRHLIAVQDVGFSEKYATFRDNVAKSELLKRLSCSVFYAEEAIFVYSTKPRSTYKMANLVNWCLLNNDPFEQKIGQLSLDDDDFRFAQQKFGDYKNLEAECKYWERKSEQNFAAYKEMKAGLDRTVAAYEKLKAELDRKAAASQEMRAEGVRGGRAGRGGARGGGAGRGGAQGGRGKQHTASISTQATENWQRQASRQSSSRPWRPWSS